MLVIGGGVVGVGSALDAAQRGLSVCLVEATDLAAGTSSRSSRLAHGGLRYLEQREFSLVHEALTERGLLLDRLAPHLVRPVPMLFPVTGKAWEKPYAGAGVALYDTLSRIGAYGGSMPRPKLLTNTAVSGLAPAMRTEELQGAVRFYDAQINDARHTMVTARTAAAEGAGIAVGVRVTGLLHDDERVVGATVETREGESFDVHARVVLSATGVWTDDLLGMADSAARPRVRQSKGAHLVVAGSAIRSTCAVIARTPLSVLFILPWGRNWLVGTTDTPYDGDLAEPTVEAADVDYLLEQANRWLHGPITREHIIGVYCGARPLVAADVAQGQDEDTTQLSREHVVMSPRPGFVAVTGGKYTTYRVMAEDAVDAVATELAMRSLTSEAAPDQAASMEMQPCRTAETPLVGAAEYPARWAERRRIARAHDLSEATVVHLLRRHGDRIDDVLELIGRVPQLAEQVHPSAPHLLAEAVLAASHEGARTLRDVMERRLRISLEVPGGAVESAALVADLMAAELGWSVARTADEVQDYRQRPPGLVPASEGDGSDR